VRGECREWEAGGYLRRHASIVDHLYHQNYRAAATSVRQSSVV